MSGLIAQSELTKMAISWICEQRDASGCVKDQRQLIDEACARFNLGPLDAEFLVRFFEENREQGRSC